MPERQGWWRRRWRWFVRDDKAPVVLNVVLWSALGLARLVSEGLSWSAGFELAFGVAGAAVLVFRMVRPRSARPRTVTEAQVRTVMRSTGGRLPEQGEPPQ